MGLEGLGMNIDMMGSLWIVMAVGAIIASIGVFMFVYFAKMHPKVGFKIYSRTGVHTKMYRVFYGKFPTKEDILSLLLGKKPVGFPIKWFSYDYFDGKQFYIAQSVDGRLFPLPLSAHLGTITFLEKQCPTCIDSEGKKLSDVLWGNDVRNCPKCGKELQYAAHVVDADYAHSLKFNPEVEKRAVYTVELDKDGNHIPLSEWIVMYDVGAKIAEAMDRSDDETKHVLEQNNPFISAIIAAAPLAIILIAFGFASYVMNQGFASAFTEGATQMSETAKYLAQAADTMAKIKGV